MLRTLCLLCLLCVLSASLCLCSVRCYFVCAMSLFSQILLNIKLIAIPLSTFFREKGEKRENAENSCLLCSLCSVRCYFVCAMSLFSQILPNIKLIAIPLSTFLNKHCKLFIWKRRAHPFPITSSIITANATAPNSSSAISTHLKSTRTSHLKRCSLPYYLSSFVSRYSFTSLNAFLISNSLNILQI
jgi:hypothetical protein